MAYSTILQIRAATGMTDETKISDDRVTSAITAADSIIDSKIGGVYQLPLSETPGIIEFCSIQLASSILYADEYGEETENLDKGWKSKQAEIFKILDSIFNRTLFLFDSSGIEFPLTGVSSIISYPNDTSNEDTNDPTAAKFTINRQW